MNENLYRSALMLIECITLMVGAASVLFILVALVCAVCGFFAKTRQPEPVAHELLARMVATATNLALTALVLAAGVVGGKAVQSTVLALLLLAAAVFGLRAPNRA